MKKYTFYEDPGHGWLKVFKKELKNLGIEKEISGCSYMLGENAYLEEDSDLSIFMVALAKENNVGDAAIDCNSEEMKNFVKEFWAKSQRNFTNNQCKVRNYASYEVYNSETLNTIEKFKTLMKSAQNWSKKGLNKINKATLADCKHWNNYYKLGYIFPE